MMQVLTPSGYRSPATLANGDEVCAFDAVTGAAIVNTVENIDFVDYAEWRRWWQVEDVVPAFNWVRVNGSFLLFAEQSIWRNGTNVCHAKHLVVGDEIYDDADHPVSITSIEVIEDNSLIWYRFDIDGDHSYIVDGLTVHNASRFWVGGTGSLDGSTTTHIAATTNGAGGASYPGSADTMTFDASSGGGTVTATADHTWQSMNPGAFTGTLDWSANNNNITLTANTIAFSDSGSGTHTINMGNGTWTLSGVPASNAITFWSTANTNLTLNANSSTLNFTGAGSSGGERDLQLGNKTYNAISFTGVGRYGVAAGIGTATIASLAFSPATSLLMGNLTWNVTSISTTATLNSPAAIIGTNTANGSTIGGNGSYNLSCMALLNVNFSGGNTRIASNSFDLGGNSGIVINTPNTTRSRIQAGF